MTLQGSLDAFALPEVLGLLASTKKSGELRVRGGWSEGVVTVKDGAIVAAEAARAISIGEALFELLRLQEGTFVFDGNVTVPDAEGVAVDVVLAEAQSRLAEWQIIAQVVPSLDVFICLAGQAPGPKVTLTAEQWRIVARVGAGCTVEAVAKALGLGEFGVCQVVKTIVDAGLVVIDDLTSDVGPSEDDLPAAPTSIDVNDASYFENSVQIAGQGDRTRSVPSGERQPRLARTGSVGRGAAALEELIQAAAIAAVDSDLPEAPAPRGGRRQSAAAPAGGGRHHARPVVTSPPETDEEEQDVAVGEGASSERDEFSLAAAVSSPAPEGAAPESEPAGRSLLMKFRSAKRA